METIRLGIVGTGISARHLHMPALLRLKDRIRVVAVFNRHRAKAEEFACDFKVPRVASTLTALLKDPEVDAVLLTLPIHLNPVIGRKVLKAGKPCLCEKPLAPTLASGERFARDAARYRAPFLVTENYVFHPMWRAFIQAVKQSIGRPRFFELRILHMMDVRNPYAQTSWRKNKPKHLGGFLGDAGVHYAAVMRRAFGEPEEVSSKILSLRPEVPPVDTMNSLLRFPGGLTGHVLYSFSIASDHGLVWKVYGEKGSLELLDGKSLVLRRGGKKMALRWDRMESFEAMHRHYHDVLVGRKKTEYPLKDALADLRLIHRMLAGR
jgi:predicted dehydrogenase